MELPTRLQSGWQKTAESKTAKLAGLGQPAPSVGGRQEQDVGVVENPSPWRTTHPAPQPAGRHSWDGVEGPDVSPPRERGIWFLKNSSNSTTRTVNGQPEFFGPIPFQLINNFCADDLALKCAFHTKIRR